MQMRSSILLALCLFLALLVSGILAIEENNDANNIQQHTETTQQENTPTINSQHTTTTQDNDDKDDTSKEILPSSSIVEQEDEETKLKKARSLYETGIQKRKYRFWLEYGSEDDWSERKQKIDIPGALKLLEEAGDLGLSEAYHAMGEIYEYGELGHIDFINARKYYEKAAAFGNPSSQAALGFLYGTGKNTTQQEGLSHLHTLFAARAGDSMAQMTIANKYYFGIGTPKSCHEAAEWYYLAAHQVVTDAEDGFSSVYEQIRLSTEAESALPIQQDEDVVQYFQYAASVGDSQSFVQLGDMHLSGQFGVDRSYVRALSYYKQAAELDNAEGLSGMATMYANGWGVEQNNLTALKYFKQAAELGSPQAQTQLGIYYYRGWNLQRNFKEALRLFTLANEQKHAPASAQLGHMYFNGDGVQKDTKKAYDYYLAGYQTGHLSSVFYLAEMYQHGYGGQLSDCPTAVALYKRVAERGLWSELLVDAHDLYEEGEYSVALNLYERLAEMGFEVAQSNAAWMYDKGLGFTVSDHSWPTEEYVENQVFRYYTRAAEQHNPAAHVILGDYYYYGKGTSVDYNKAARCYDDARKQVHVQPSQLPAVAQALFNLGYMHEHGIGLDKDLFLAKRFYDDALTKNEDAYIAVWLALAKLGLHYLHDIITGELDFSYSSFSSSSSSSPSSPSPSPSSPSSFFSSSSTPAIFSRLKNVQWDNILIVILSTILGFLIVVRQRRMLQQQQQQQQQQQR